LRHGAILLAVEEYFTIIQSDRPLGGATSAKHGESIGDYSLRRLISDRNICPATLRELWL
jgi:hypothetical protein